MTNTAASTWLFDQGFLTNILSISLFICCLKKQSFLSWYELNPHGFVKFKLFKLLKKLQLNMKEKEVVGK